MSNNTSTILEILDIFHDDRRFCAPHITQLFELIEDEHGFIHPATALGAEERSTFDPIALKPSSQQKRTSIKDRKIAEKQRVKRDDKQLKLFPD